MLIEAGEVVDVHANDEFDTNKIMLLFLYLFFGLFMFQNQPNKQFFVVVGAPNFCRQWNICIFAGETQHSCINFNQFYNRSYIMLVLRKLQVVFVWSITQTKIDSSRNACCLCAMKLTGDWSSTRKWSLIDEIFFHMQSAKYDLLLPIRSLSFLPWILSVKICPVYMNRALFLFNKIDP